VDLPVAKMSMGVDASETTQSSLASSFEETNSGVHSVVDPHRNGRVVRAPWKQEDLHQESQFQRSDHASLASHVQQAADPAAPEPHHEAHDQPRHASDVLVQTGTVNDGACG